MSFTLNSIAQETEQFYFDKAAKEYYNGKMEAAQKTIDLGLSYYPGNQKLVKLNKCLPKDKLPKIPKEGRKGHVEGVGPKGPQTPNPAPKSPPPPPCKFNEQERSLLSRGFKEGYGSDGEEEKTLTDCNGAVHTYFKKKIPVNKDVYASFTKTGQNAVQWSEDLKNNAAQITIIFNNGLKTFSDDVTGATKYKFESGDKDFDGVECTVTLKITLKTNVKLKDVPKLKMTTHC